jgi:hypothetical protein
MILYLIYHVSDKRFGNFILNGVTVSVYYKKGTLLGVVYIPAHYKDASCLSKTLVSAGSGTSS